MHGRSGIHTSKVKKYGLQQKKKVGIYIYLEKMLRLSKRMKIMLQLQKN